MTSIDSVGGAAVAAVEKDTEILETVKEEVTAISEADPSPNSGMARMQEEEALQKAVAPNLREVNAKMEFAERVGRIKSLIQDHMDYRKDKAYLLCVKKFASTDLHLAKEFAEKIKGHQCYCKISMENKNGRKSIVVTPDYNRKKIIAYILISKYQSDENAAKTLKEAAAFFSACEMNEVFQILDEAFHRGLPIASSIHKNVYEKLQENARWSPSFHNLLNLAEFEEKYQLPNLKNTMEKVHARSMTEERESSCWNKDNFFRLLECEMRLNHPLHLETSDYIRELIKGDLDNWIFEKNLAHFLQIEARNPELFSFFKKDISWALGFTKKDTLYKIVKEIVPYQISIARDITETIEDEYYKTLAWLEILKVQTQNLDFDREQNFVLLKEKIQNINMCYPKLFLRAAKVFGVENTLFILDKAIEASIEEGKEKIIYEELKKGPQEIVHYVAKALGADYPHPYPEGFSSIPEKELTKFSKIDAGDLGDVLKCLRTYSLPGMQEVLQRMYDNLEEDDHDYWDTDILEMVKTELSLIS